MAAPAPAGTVDEVMAVQQGKKVTGVVVDGTGEPVIGANVVVKGTTNGTITDFDGNYTIEGVPADGVLVISYIGYLADGDLSEVIYGDQYCVLRAAKGKADISGDYNDYARKDKRTLNGVKVELFAISDNKSVDCYNLAKWHKGQYSYSMYTENGMSLKTIEKYMERLSYGSMH